MQFHSWYHLQHLPLTTRESNYNFMAYKTHICAAFDGIYACVSASVCVFVYLCVKQNVTKNFFHASLSPLPSLSLSLSVDCGLLFSIYTQLPPMPSLDKQILTLKC